MSNAVIDTRKIAIVDCQLAGISGDMFLGALIDLGADVNKLLRAVEVVEGVIGCDIRVDIEKSSRRGIKATRVDVQAECRLKMTGAKLVGAIRECMENLGAGHGARKFALNVTETLLEAEATLHSWDSEKAHLHELGGTDTIVEIVGSAIAIEELGLFNARVYSTPVAVGGGSFEFSHGKYSAPAPATLEILRSRGFPMRGGPLEAELTTPTGASILVNFADIATNFYPAIRPRKIGYGAGARDFEEVANILRIILGEPVNYNLAVEEVVVLETNVDDVTGETMGYLLDKLLGEGARDACIVPAFMKKNRPGCILKVIADRERAEHLAKVIIRETGSLGVRLSVCERRVLRGETVPVEAVIDGIREYIRVKVSRDTGGTILQIKPEYEDVKMLAEKTGKPLMHIVRIVEAQARKLILGEGL